MLETIPRMRTAAGIVARYSVKIATVWDWIRNGRMPAVKVGKAYLVRQEDLQRFEAAHYTEKEGKT